MVDAPPPPERDSLAAELALGLLDGTERAEALRLCLSDPAFAAAVEAWGLRLSPLLDEIAPVAPLAHVWGAVEARIGAQQPAALVRTLRRWQAGALLSGALAASLAAVVVLRPAPVSVGPAAPMAVAQLAGADGVTGMAIAYDPQKGMLHLSPPAMEMPGKSPELWVIPADGVPRSLGMIHAHARGMSVGMPMRPFLAKGAILAVTMEDPATMPHKAPSGAPMLTGKISLI